MHILLLLAELDEGAEIAVFAVLSDDVQVCRDIVDDVVIVPDDVQVPQLTHDIDLRHQQLLLLVRHEPILDALPHENLRTHHIGAGVS